MGWWLFDVEWDHRRRSDGGMMIVKRGRKFQTFKLFLKRKSMRDIGIENESELTLKLLGVAQFMIHERKASSFNEVY